MMDELKDKLVADLREEMKAIRALARRAEARGLEVAADLARLADQLQAGLEELEGEKGGEEGKANS